MSRLVIDGGHKLSGTITASGNKNAALKLLPACLLTDEPIILHNIPDIADVRTVIEIISDLGAEVDDLGDGSWRIHAENITKSKISPELAGRIRASFVFSGPMLARMGSITLPGPGGDVIGGRPLDTNIQGLKALGVEVDLDALGTFHMTAPTLIGAGYLLQAEASVTATENTVMAAVMAKGETIIDNAAREPHTEDLCRFLSILGAKIEGIGTSRLTITGVDKLNGGEFTIGSDYMEVGSFIGAAALTEGEVRIKNANPNNLGMIDQVFRRLGVHWEVEGEDIIVPDDQTLEITPALGGRIPEIKTHPWPGFPPDLMSIAVVIASQAAGSVLLHDWMYESRFFFVDKLIFMGARIVLCDPHRVLVQGPSTLFANPQGVTSPDIRAGMAMVLAALCARGQSTIYNIQQIDRGYQRIDRKLQTLGAQVTRVES
ncbi:MAG TPA: UDP-N-acetylglucosamine 1-carboxyvinyltransferase [candidate division Zixibacteria bacterium]|nr:UDP-N-acetylglucosamine 1-carboxyvinyltransferase [candidate division Zixibacteria bacterium]